MKHGSKPLGRPDSLKEELLHTLVIPIIIFAKILGNGFRCGGWPKILTPSCI